MTLSLPFRVFATALVCLVSFAFTDCTKKAVPATGTSAPVSGTAAPAMSSSSRRNTPPIPVHGNPPPSMAGMEKEILRYVNQDRQERGLKPLELNAVESTVATQHSKNMASGRTPFGHKGLQLRMNTIERQIGTLSATGENVAYGQMSAREVVSEWLNSPVHKKNIEGDFTLTGIGWAKDAKGQIFYTQIFTR